MTYAAIMVHAEASEFAEPRLRFAVSVANLFGASLIGVGAEIYLPGVELASAEALRVQDKGVQADVRLARERFEPIASFVTGGSEWRAVVDEPSAALVRESRAADLIIASRTEATQGGLRSHANVGDLLLGAGRPILIAPPHQTRLEPCRVMVAWKDTRESRRAVADALPFLQKAARVRVVQVCEPAVRLDAEAQITDVAAALHRHGVDAEVEVLSGADASAADRLREACDAWDADLFVAGGFGRSRVREWVFGGVTHELLRDFPGAVLLSH